MENSDETKIDRRRFIQTAGVPEAMRSFAPRMPSDDKAAPATRSRSSSCGRSACVDNGFLHAVAVIMAAQSYWQG